MWHYGFNHHRNQTSLYKDYIYIYKSDFDFVTALYTHAHKKLHLQFPLPVSIAMFHEFIMS